MGIAIILIGIGLVICKEWFVLLGLCDFVVGLSYSIDGVKTDD